jgi:hypothetical protein
LLHLLHVLTQRLPPTRGWWLPPVILATLEVEIKRIMVRSQSRQIVRETLSQKNKKNKKTKQNKNKTHHRKRAGGVAQDVGPEFKAQYHTQKKGHSPCGVPHPPNLESHLPTDLSIRWDPPALRWIPGGFSSVWLICLLPSQRSSSSW